jgi:cell division septum initiation protein DivIVA
MSRHLAPEERRLVEWAALVRAPAGSDLAHMRSAVLELASKLAETRIERNQFKADAEAARQRVKTLETDLHLATERPQE